MGRHTGAVDSPPATSTRADLLRTVADLIDQAGEQAADVYVTCTEASVQIQCQTAASTEEWARLAGLPAPTLSGPWPGAGFKSGSPASGLYVYLAGPLPAVARLWNRQVSA